MRTMSAFPARSEAEGGGASPLRRLRVIPGRQIFRAPNRRRADDRADRWDRVGEVDRGGPAGRAGAPSSSTPTSSPARSSNPDRRCWNAWWSGSEPTSSGRTAASTAPGWPRRRSSTTRPARSSRRSPIPRSARSSSARSPRRRKARWSSTTCRSSSNRRIRPRYRAVIVVEAPRELRLARLEARGIRGVDAERRMAQQATDEQRRAVATWVIDNSGDLDALAARVERLWPELVAFATVKTTVEIDRQLVACGWVVQDRKAMNLYAGQGVAVREFIMATGPRPCRLPAVRRSEGGRCDRGEAVGHAAGRCGTAVGEVLDRPAEGSAGVGEAAAVPCTSRPATRRCSPTGSIPTRAAGRW